MSFYPLELIFIGWVADMKRFYWVLRNFEFWPANGIFSQKGKFLFFQKVLFWGVWCRKWSLNKIGVMDVSNIIENKSNRLNTTFPNIFSLISADDRRSGRFIKKSKKSFFQKNWRFLDQKCALEGRNLVQLG